MDLQSYRHDCFSKISRTLFDFLNNTYWVSLFLRNNSLIFRTGISCFSVALFYSTLFCCGRKANLVRFILFYSTLLTLTDRQKDGWRNEYTRFAWAGGTFISSCAVTSVFYSGRKKVVVLHTTYLLWSTIKLWCCVSFFRSGGKYFLVFLTYGTYCTVTVVHLCQFFGCGGK
jgi:hypothetical protein